MSRIQIFFKKYNATVISAIFNKMAKRYHNIGSIQWKCLGHLLRMQKIWVALQLIS
jgi:hypothetical protein